MRLRQLRYSDRNRRAKMNFDALLQGAQTAGFTAPIDVPDGSKREPVLSKVVSVFIHDESNFHF